MLFSGADLASQQAEQCPQCAGTGYDCPACIADLEHEQPEGAQGERNSLRSALEQAYMALIGYLPAHRNAVADAAIEAARAALAQPSTTPELDDQAFDDNVERLT